MFGPDLLLPPRAVLLHIGPHKTGTTAIQSSLRQARDAMARQHVTYASRGRVHMRPAALAATGRPGLRGDTPSDEKHWQQLAADVDAAGNHRVVISSEFLCDADDETARQIVADLGGERVHVVVTLRHLGKILPSSWQQYIRNRTRYSYDYWLEHTLNGEPYVSPTESFWRRHRHDALIARWASVVGADRVAVIVLDESDRLMLYRTFERMTGLSSGTLAETTELTNRSLTAAEVEFVRQLNYDAVAENWSDRVYHQCIRQGAAAALQRRPPTPDEARIVTPRWALQRAAEIGGAEAARIRALGVHLVGDLDSLGAPPADGTTDDDPTFPTTIAIDRVKEAVIGAVRGAGRLPPKNPPPTGDARPLASVSSRELLGAVGRRVKTRLHLAPPPIADVDPTDVDPLEP